jgi:hypothetical protein
MHANAPPIFSTVIFHCGGGAGRQLQPVLTPQNSKRSDAKFGAAAPQAGAPRCTLRVAQGVKPVAPLAGGSGALP